MEKVVVDLYCRVSSVEQATEGYSIGEQETRLRAYAAAQGWTVNACYVDPGFSGASLVRPGIQKVIRDAKSHTCNKVLTYKLDRLSRSQKDTLYLIEDVFQPNGVGYASMTEAFDTSTPFGMAMVGILSVFAQLEREQIKERMMMGRIASAKEGNWRGGSGVPIGYRYIPKTATEDGRLVIDPYEAQIVKKVFDLFLSGRTFNSIYTFCREHYTTSYGSFAGGGAHLIPNMLANRAYIGEIKYQGQWYKGKHEPILEQATFDRAQAKLKEYQANLCEHRRNAYKAKHLLTGFLWCGECGARWCYHTCTYKRRSDGEKRSYDTYCCYTKNRHKTQAKADGCSISVWPAAELEGLIWSQIHSLSLDEVIEAANPHEEEIQAYCSQLAAVHSKQEKLIDLYAVGNLPLEVIQRRSDELANEAARLQELVEALQSESIRPDLSTFRAALEASEAVEEYGDIEAQRDLLKILIRKITLLPERKVRIEWNI